MSRSFLVAACLGIAVATLVPTGGIRAPFTLCVVCGIHGGADAVDNVLLFVPLGVALAVNGYKGWRFVLLATLLSACIELAQFVIPGRDPSVGDVTFNAIGAALGQFMMYLHPYWGQRDARRAARFSLLASTVAVLTLVFTGWLYAPDFPPTAYHVWWKAETPGMESVRGRFLRGGIGSTAVSSRNGPLPAGTRTQLAAGIPLWIDATAGPPPPELRPLFAIRDDHHHEIVLLAPDRTDVVLRYRLNAARLRLDQPDLRLREALLGVGNSDTLHIEARRAGPYACLRVNQKASCALGFTLGDGWALLFFPRHLPPWLPALLNGAWLAALTIPVGFWARRRWESVCAAALLAGGFIAAPFLTGLAATPASQCVAVMVGWVAGHRLGRMRAGP